MIETIPRCVKHAADSGAEETRTPDFLLAKEALYQLSYGPKAAAPLWGRCTCEAHAGGGRRAVVQTGPQAGETVISVANRQAEFEPDRALWAFVDSNHRPLPYQGSALTS